MCELFVICSLVRFVSINKQISAHHIDDNLNIKYGSRHKGKFRSVARIASHVTVEVTLSWRVNGRDLLHNSQEFTRSSASCLTLVQIPRKVVCYRGSFTESVIYLRHLRVKESFPLSSADNFFTTRWECLN
jgi:hypothetical protein